MTTITSNGKLHRDTTALITGGTQGLGLAVAENLIADGCRKIVLSGRNAEKGAELAANLSTDGVEVQFVAADLGDVDQVFNMVDTAAEMMGSVTALVNAGANTDRGSILDTTPEMWDALFDVNAKGCFFALQRFAQRAIAADHPASAVNILSIVVHAGLPFLAPYAASKAALLNITKNSANTLAPNKIRVNGINVGWMDPPGADATQKKWHNAPDDGLEREEARMPLGQLVKPYHVAGLVNYLVGPASGVMTGSIIDFDQQVVGAYPDTNE